MLRFPDSTGWFAVDSIDLSGVRSVTVLHRWRNPPEFGFGYEVHLDAMDGKIIGKGNLPALKSDDRTGEIRIALPPIDDKKFHKLYFILKRKPSKTPFFGGVSQLMFSSK